MDKKEDKKDIKKPKGLSATKKPLDGIDIHPQLKVTKESEAEDLTASLQERKALTVAQRLKRAREMRAREPKLQRAKEVAARRLASEEKLKRRAEVAAREIVKRRFSPRRNIPYAELTTAEKIQVDTAVAKKVNLVKKLAARLLPSIRKAEASRLQSFHKGEKLKDLSTPSPQSQAIAPKMDAMKEEMFANLNQCSEEELVDVIESMIIDFKANDNPLGSTLQDLLFNVLPKDHITESLITKSNRSGIPYTVLREVFERGLNSYENRRMTPEQFAFTRVNSYIARGNAYRLDEDLRNPKPISEIDAAFSESYEFVQNRPYVKVNPETGQAETVHPKRGARKIKTKDFAKMKEEVEHNNCGTSDCCRQCDTAFEAYTQNKRSAVNRGPQYKSPPSTKAKTKIQKNDYVVHPKTNKPSRVLDSDPKSKTATIKTHGGSDTSTHAWSELKHYSAYDKMKQNDATKNEEVQQTNENFKRRLGNKQKDPKKREIGTSTLAKAYMDDTPGQADNLNENFNMAMTAGIGITLTASDLGMKTQGGFSYHPSVIAQMEAEEETEDDEV